MGVEAAGGNDRTLKKRRERSTLEKKSTLRTRSVSGFVLLFLLLLTLFEGQASAAKTKELLAIAGKVDPEKVRQLIQDGADVNAKDKDGATPLMLAAKHKEALTQRPPAESRWVVLRLKVAIRLKPAEKTSGLMPA